MPFRQIKRLTACYTFFNGNIPNTARLLHASRYLRRPDAGQNHYEILKIGENASASEIKKSFYSLSKTHHPDHNPSDPEAPARFMRISDAYSVLSSPDKRAAYDRDVMSKLHHQHGQHPHHAATKGSYSSTGPAGGRAASGLSRRRRSTTFTGPPPSFFRNGGWGAHGAKRAAAHEASSGGGTGTRAEQPPPGGGTWGATGMGFGFGQGQRAEDVPHFDQEGHERTHQRINRRRASSTGFEPPMGSEDSFISGFIIVSATLAVALVVPALLLGQKRDKGEPPVRKGSV